MLLFSKPEIFFTTFTSFITFMSKTFYLTLAHIAFNSAP